MKFAPPLERAIFRRRYRRFFADVDLADGRALTIHCVNTGSLKNCLAPGQPCWFARAPNPLRKLPGTLEIVTTATGELAGVNTARANGLVREGIATGAIAELQGYATSRAEVRYGDENSRIDLLLESPGRKCFVEVKNLTLAEEAGRGLFPDAVTARGAKHLRELIAVVAQGHRGVLMFCVQLSGVDRVAPADHIDPVYGQTLRRAVAAGVEVLAYGCRLGAGEIAIDRKLEFRLPPG